MTESFQLDAAPQEVVVQQKAPMLLGRTRLVPGLTLFSCNKETGEVEKVEFSSSVYEINSTKVKHKVTHKPGYAYIQALNLKNAKRKFAKLLN